ncbi:MULTISPECIES: dihydroxyacetone kinase subunit DhaL [unclassified Streptomyces]|uniref:dihydroxyacetone kinase subunit DhaL n=1 Tax=unclassified Streptomyces TaxID=2593676 RepID=UPI0001C1A776|nr:MULTISPECIES: dihydroxyacetone kinase subunit DhaL [unclassified Streptomyces]AEN08390.1 dihydroxyacetone kinase, L subunit [Streptomyces sp. SirexAA-E]MYR66373.1 dihydroxyacetone kinase subunit L [Streptomyces sp. SID4939]MYS03922.1 dihydroxyacetone kinase subunit L [Streptomyces sp. SID4940]MYT66466.1 dihydroxyacetone kinase subunit L [Streptomyces sp. SID8357]MYT83387.1 dihydroxyacetone kinase subunit L [Streptomyces sp. SID8360]
MTTPAFDGTLTRDWMHRFADSVYATEAELTALDQRVGDGDFGTNLTAGVRAAGHLLDAGGAEAGPSETLGCMATAFLDEIGGTSGPLFGLLFQALSRSASGNGLTSDGLAEGVEQGLAAIRRVGDAAPGDKTLVDALTPAAAALRGASGGTPPDRALSLAADAAWQGVHDTAGLSARMGRASYLGERVTGIPDPGAVGVALLFASAAGPVHTLAPYLPGGG